MADNSATDVLMMFRAKGPKSLGGDSQTAFRRGDTLGLGFKADGFFEVEEFSLGASIEDSDSGMGGENGLADSQKELQSMQKGQERMAEMLATLNAAAKAGGGKGAAGIKPSKPKGRKFSKYVTGSQQNNAISADDPLGYGYVTTIDEITISRQMDSASVSILMACLQQQALQDAVLVKRRFTGGKTSDAVVSHECFLRVKFKEPLITSVEWKDGETVKEDIKFVCRGIEVAYRKQANDGSHLGSDSQAYEYKTKTS